MRWKIAIKCIRSCCNSVIEFRRAKSEGCVSEKAFTLIGAPRVEEVRMKVRKEDVNVLSFILTSIKG